ncbi:putative FAD dependent oxidoreductase [Colletotrichum karsti]|uniref:FAD dependent oxidoreductase n=1 Tax=Colletotrichum karsti TaxID=1095194 RepID=A0A9P6LP16_9PEZI|nr:putative FAD dependent oxidoreductase [Colletotrichum karsti]KAF9880305.1 putative FAD dependent oxidoreductase [Colletotrichum karsti]
MKPVLSFVLPFLPGLLAQDPGLPVSNPSISYWQLPPLDGIADHQSQQLPAEADVVIIGSGMSGTSIAWHLLKDNTTSPLRIAMIEARQACSGATGRNGGHIRPSSYSEYAGAKESVSQTEAAKITRLRSAHVDALISAANSLPEEGRQAAEARAVDSIDAFFDENEWKNVMQQLEVLKREVPDVGKEWTMFGKEEARNISLLTETVGILTGTPKVAGAIWPYRFITHALKALLDDYPSFSLDTSTAALNVSSIVDTSSKFNFEVTTSRGKILAKNVVYATNAWTPHFVPGLRGVIQGGRLHMSAQLGGSGLPKAGSWPSYTGNGSLSGGRAWSLFRNGLDYIVQMPRNGEYMFGGGIEGDEPGTAFPSDSGPPNHAAVSYLNGALPNYFGYDTYGAERTDFPETSDANVWPGRTKRVWVGIEGSSSDSRPYVGRLPETATNRAIRNTTSGGEWVSAAFDVEGMCFAWLCGRALSQMIKTGSSGTNSTAGLPDWFPQSFLVTEERLSKGNITRRGKNNWMYPRMANALRWY